jgi:hypothetical protein
MICVDSERAIRGKIGAVVLFQSKVACIESPSTIERHLRRELRCKLWQLEKTCRLQLLHSTSRSDQPDTGGTVKMTINRQQRDRAWRTTKAPGKTRACLIQVQRSDSSGHPCSYKQGYE